MFQSLEPEDLLGGLPRPVLRIEDVHLLRGHPQLAHSLAPRPVHVLPHLGRHLEEWSRDVHHRRTIPVGGVLLGQCFPEIMVSCFDIISL